MVASKLHCLFGSKVELFASNCLLQEFLSCMVKEHTKSCPSAPPPPEQAVDALRQRLKSALSTHCAIVESNWTTNT